MCCIYTWMYHLYVIHDIMYILVHICAMLCSNHVLFVIQNSIAGLYKQICFSGKSILQTREVSSKAKQSHAKQSNTIKTQCARNSAVEEITN